jgi:transposase
MSTNRGAYTRDFKQEAIRLSETGPKTTAELEVDLGLPKGLLAKWKQQLAEAGQEAFRGQGRLTASEAEMRQLKQENEILRQEREILKKALAIPSTALRTGFTRSQR